MAINTPSERFLCAATGSILYEPVRCTQNHVVERIYLEVRQLFNDHTCPVNGCAGSMEGRQVDTKLQGEISKWLENSPDVLGNLPSIALTRAVEQITDPLHKGIFRHVHRLNCGHHFDETSLSNIMRIGVLTCITCDTVVQTETADTALQERINTFVKNHGLDHLQRTKFTEFSNECSFLPFVVLIIGTPWTAHQVYTRDLLP